MRIPADPVRFMTPPPLSGAGDAAAPGGVASRAADAGPAGDGEPFRARLAGALEEVGAKQAEAGRMVIDLATGQDVSLHETMIAMEEAGLAFKLLVQVRNKALEAYQEVMRTQV